MKRNLIKVNQPIRSRNNSINIVKTTTHAQPVDVHNLLGRLHLGDEDDEHKTLVKVGSGDLLNTKSKNQASLSKYNFVMPSLSSSRGT